MGDYIHDFAVFIVGLLPPDWQVSPTVVALLLWLILWAASMVAFVWLAIYLLVYKSDSREDVDYRSTLR